MPKSIPSCKPTIAIALMRDMVHDHGGRCISYEHDNMHIQALCQKGYIKQVHHKNTRPQVYEMTRKGWRLLLDWEHTWGHVWTFIEVWMANPSATGAPDHRPEIKEDRTWIDNEIAPRWDGKYEVVEQCKKSA